MHPETASSSRQQSTSFDTDTDQDLDDEMQDEASADKSGWNLLTGLGVFMLLIFVAFCYYLIKDLTARIVYRIKEGKWPESESSMRKRQREAGSKKIGGKNKEGKRRYDEMEQITQDSIKEAYVKDLEKNYLRDK